MSVQRISRRTFSRMVAGTFLTGDVLDAAVRETRDQDKLSDQTALTLLQHIGYEPTLPDEMNTLRPMLEQTIKDLQTIREFQLPMSLEPAFVFHPDR
jgi:hypothetical protein